MHNSARSQMAEAFLNNLAGDRFEVKSAGLEPGTLNPVVVKSMMEMGIDISNNRTKSVNEFIGEQFDYVITVCDAVDSERCPVFPGKTVRLHWGFKDPSKLTGSHEEKLEEIRRIRDGIKNTIEEWVNELQKGGTDNG